jgi:hypothetical protein
MMATRGDATVASGIGGGMARIWSNPIPTAVRCLIWSVVVGGLGGVSMSSSPSISTLLGGLSTLLGLGLVVLVLRRLWIFARDRAGDAVPTDRPQPRDR